uniref:Uncharacterized protein n=1 Tax=Bracon brevicornis TaxID=1563983 RepID=A0A6V7JP05_9HYME
MYEFLLYAGMVVLAAVVFITLITNYHSAEDEKIKRNGSAVTGIPMELDNSENLTRDSTITRL